MRHTLIFNIEGVLVNCQRMFQNTDSPGSNSRAVGFYVGNLVPWHCLGTIDGSFQLPETTSRFGTVISVIFTCVYFWR